MDARLDYLGSPLALKVVKHINSAWAVLHDSALPAATQELVKLRASQINGCGFCTDMHIKDALHAAESQQRLNLVAVWRERACWVPNRSGSACPYWDLGMGSNHLVSILYPS